VRVPERSGNRGVDTSHFIAKDADGVKVVLRLRITTSTQRFSRPVKVLEVLELFTPDGSPVLRLAKGVYEVLATGQRLTSDDPHAT
jgi:hypothetical protein